MKALFSLLFIAFSFISFSQKDTAYIYTFGGENDEQGRDIELTSDSGFIMVGSTSSFGAGNSDIYLVKVDSNIKYEWSAAIGHQFTEFGHAVKQTADNGYIICGYTNSIGNGTYDAYLVRTDDKGKLLWEKTFGGFDWDFAYDVEITNDRGFLIVGETHSLGNGNADAYLIKTDKDGNLLWEKTMGGSGKDIAHALISTNDGNFAFCGENASKNPENNGDSWMVKFNGNGDTLIDRTYALEEADKANDIVQTKKGYALIGTSRNLSVTSTDILTFGTNEIGVLKWTRYHGGVVGQHITDDEGYGIKEYSNGNLLITGNSPLGNGGINVYTGMLDEFGNGITAPSYGESGSDFGSQCIILPGQGEVFFGTTESVSSGYFDFQLIKVDTVDGNKIHLYNSHSDSLEQVVNEIKETDNSETVIIFPNPFIDRIFMTDQNSASNVYVVNCIGEKVRSIQTILNGILEIEIDTDEPNGVYSIVVNNGDSISVIKALKSN